MYDVAHNAFEETCTRVAFDPEHELVWTGLQSGYVTSMQIPTMEVR